MIRSKEVEFIKENKDPLKIFREKVKGKIDEAKLDEIDAASKANVDDAVAKPVLRHIRNQNNSLLTSMSLTKGIVKMPNKSFRNAIKEAIESEMRRDPTVFVVGEDVRGGHGGKTLKKVRRFRWCIGRNQRFMDRIWFGTCY